MGVKSLWQLLEPVGKRINIEALQGKKLAIDASIWLNQFVKAMRDDQGELIRNAHLLGFFRRICRLLFHNIKPVFVFDGVAPAIKRRTTLLRRQRRELASAKTKKIAEKLLLARLKERHLQNLGSEPLTAPPPPPKRRKTAAAAAKAARAESAPAATAARVAGGSSSDDADGDGSPPQPGASRQAAPDVSTDDADMDDDKQRAGRIRADTLLDAELAVQLAAEPEQSAGPHEGGSAMGGLATARLGSRMDDGAGPSSAPPAEGGGTSDEQDTGPARGARPQRGGGASAAFDALREAKAAAEARSTARASGLPPPAAAAPADDASSDDSDEELVLVPEGVRELDSTVLSTLPISMQYDALVKMRERMQTENRQGFTDRQGRPLEFSSYQMKHFLKSAEHKARTERLRDVLSGRIGPEGAQARHIAGEKDREYILHDADVQQPEAEPEAAGVAIAEAALDIDVDLPAGFLEEESQPKAEDDDDLEWENIGPDGAAMPAEPKPVAGPTESSGQRAAAGMGVARDWRTRMKERQRFWSVSHGFKGGRKLADWDRADAAEEAGAGGTEDAELAAAIQLSLAESPVKGASPIDSEDEGDVVVVDEDRPAGSVQTVQTAQTANQRRDATASDGRGADGDADAAAEAGELRAALALSVSGSGQADATDAAAQPSSSRRTANKVPDVSQPADSDEDADTWQFMALPTARLQQQPEQPAAATASPPGPAMKQPSAVTNRASGSRNLPAADSRRNPASAVPSPSPEAAPVSAEPASEAWEAELEPEEPVDGGRTGAAAIAAAAAVKSALAGRDTPGSSMQPAPLAHSGPRSGSGGSDLQWEDTMPTDSAPTHPTQPSHSAPSPDDEVIEWEDVPPASPAQPALAAAEVDHVSRSAAANGLPPTEQSYPQPTQRADGDLVDDDVELPTSGDGATASPHSVPVSPAKKRRRLLRLRELEQQGSPGKAGRVGQQAQPQQHQQPRSNANGLHGSSAEPPDAAADPPQSAFAADEVQTTAGGAAAGGSASGAMDPAVGLAPGAPQAAPPGGRGDTAAAAPQEAVESAALTPSLASRLEAGTGILALSQDDSRPSADRLAAGTGVLASQGSEPDADELAEEAAAATALDSDAALLESSAGLPSGSIDADALLRLSSQPSFDIDAELETVQGEQKKLRREKRRLAQSSDNPTNEMYAECQELLQLFGLPYIIAPTEAEAQCAWLDAAGLVDGVVTDDNDVFLFGGNHVYRNMFDNKKYVEEYRAADAAEQLGLDRPKLIRMAHLLGSDYTTGISGIGVVNAVEVVHAFDSDDGLIKFRRWVLSPDTDEFASAVTGGSGRGRGRGSRGRGRGRGRGRSGSSSELPEVEELEEAGSHGSGAPDAESESAAVAAYKRSHRAARKNWGIPPDFANPAATEAFLRPRVDSSKARFTFARPDEELLADFCAAKMGWTQEKVAEELKPVLERFDSVSTQRTMHSFLKFEQRFAKFQSKRLASAVKGIAGGSMPEELVLAATDAVLPSTPPGRGRKRSGSSSGGDLPSVELATVQEEEPEEDQPRPKAKRKPSKKRVANTAAVEAAQPSTPPAPERLPSDHGLHVTEVQINRAPVLTLWVAEVAKRQGHDEEAALTFGKAVANTFSQAKGQSLGILPPERWDAQAQRRLDQDGDIEQVAVFGRYLTAKKVKGSYRAVDSSGKVIAPGPVRGYIQRAFGADLGAAQVAMRTLAEAYPPGEIGERAYGLYVEFRPDVNAGRGGWGQKNTLSLTRIRDMASAAAAGI